MPPRMPGAPSHTAPVAVAAPPIATGPIPVANTTDLVRAAAHDVSAVLAISEHARLANQTNELPNFANSVTGIYGISGAGKTSLIVTAIEFAWENFEAISLVYATDLGGFGNKLLSLVRLGIARVWDPRNHVNSFETMEMISLGAWPEHILDAETGKADPNVRLILPRRIVTTLLCPQGHPIQRFDLASPTDAALFATFNHPCPTCSVVTSKDNGRTLAQIVRHKMFRRVGHRAYDSMTEMNDWGMMRLAEMSARGLLPVTNSEKGGSLLGSADALREGTVTYGGGSFQQVGFMQNRSYQWIANIRSIPDQVMPATCTFAVEQGKADDDSGGVPCLGPQIAGNARTTKVPRWVGNCLHASRERDDVGRMRHRLWLTTHLNPDDKRNLPYLAKHRGIPLDMPDYLEDPWDDDPKKRADLAWTVCSLKVFYVKLIEQLAKIEARDRMRYANAPALVQAADDETGDEVIADVTPPALAPPIAVSAGPRVPIAGGQTLSARRGALRMPGVAPAPAPPPLTIPAQTVAIPSTAAPPVAAGNLAATVSSAAPPAASTAPVTAAGPAPSLIADITPEAKPVHVQQLEASLAQRAPDQVPATAQPAPLHPPAASTPSTAAAPASGRLRMPGGLRVPGAVSAAAPPTTAAPAAQTAPAASAPAPAAAVAPAPAVAPHAGVAPAPSPMPIAPAPPSRMPARRTPRPPV